MAADDGNSTNAAISVNPRLVAIVMLGGGAR
jgi:hypothetical protein